MEDSETSPSSNEGTNDNIEDVRDLLFGKRTAEISGRIEETENNLRSAIFRMEERVESKLGVMEGLIEDKLNALESRNSELEHRLNDVANARVEMDNEYRSSIDQIESKFSGKLVSIEERFHKFETVIWNELDSNSRKQSEEVSSVKKELLKRIEEEISLVEDKSTDLTKLGEFLIDLGLKIQPPNESPLTSGDRSESQPELAG